MRTAITQPAPQNPYGKKALIVAAGPVANFLLTISILTYFVYTVGIASTQPVVGEVIPKDTPAAAAGLKPGDRILMIDKKKMRMISTIFQKRSSPISTRRCTLTVERGESINEAHHHANCLRPTRTSPAMSEKRPLIGIRSQQIS